MCKFTHEIVEWLFKKKIQKRRIFHYKTHMTIIHYYRLIHVYGGFSFVLSIIKKLIFFRCSALALLFSLILDAFSFFFLSLLLLLLFYLILFFVHFIFIFDPLSLLIRCSAFGFLYSQCLICATYMCLSGTLRTFIYMMICTHNNTMYGMTGCTRNLTGSHWVPRF